jgi:hypothetical protein
VGVAVGAVHASGAGEQPVAAVSLWMSVFGAAMYTGGIGVLAILGWEWLAGKWLRVNQELDDILAGSDLDAELDELIEGEYRAYGEVAPDEDLLVLATCAGVRRWSR